jgi:hypothetical protein
MLGGCPEFDEKFPCEQLFPCAEIEGCVRALRPLTRGAAHSSKRQTCLGVLQGA